MGTLVQSARERLHQQRGRMTSQRKLIIEALESLGSHPTAEELYEAIQPRDPSLNLSTVYRTLRWMEQEGLICARRFIENHHQERFDPVSPSEHYHFLCTSCKRVIEFGHPLIDSIKSQFETQTGAKIETAAVVLYGLCSQCQKKLMNP